MESIINQHFKLFVLNTVLSAVAAINQTLEVGNTERTFEALSDPDAVIPNLEEENSDRYHKHLKQARVDKLEVHMFYQNTHLHQTRVDKLKVHVLSEFTSTTD